MTHEIEINHVPRAKDPYAAAIARQKDTLKQTFIALLNSLAASMQSDSAQSSLFQELQSTGKLPETLVNLLKPVTTMDPYVKASKSAKIKNLANNSGVSTDTIGKLQSEITSNQSLAGELIRFAFETNPDYQPQQALSKPPSFKDLSTHNAQHRAIQEARRQQTRQEELGELL